MTNEPGLAGRPTFSVIIATYQRAPVVGRAIESVFAQQDSDFELIVVDDGSTDGTGQGVGEIQDPRLRLIVFPANRGVAAARNSAIEAATGRYLVFLDSDDELLPDALTAMREAWAVERDPTVGQQVFRIEDATSGVKLGRLDGDGVLLDYLDLLCARNGVGGDFCAAHRSETFERPAFDPELRGFEGVTWLRIRRRWLSRGHQQVVYRAHRERPEQRLSGTTSRIRRAAVLADGNRRLLVEHGEAMRQGCQAAYHATLRRAVGYAVLAADRRKALRTLIWSVRRFGMSVETPVLAALVAAGHRPIRLLLQLRDRWT